MYWPGIGTFRVQNGSLVTIWRDPQVTDDRLRLSLLGPVLAAVLHQRGFLVLHASAVQVGEGAIVIAAPSGRGKSTLAGALLTRGARLVADDVVPVRQAIGEWPSVFSGPTYLKLWPVAAGRLGHDPNRLPRLAIETEKRRTSIPTHSADALVRLHAVYLLAGGREPAIEDLETHPAVTGLMEHSYCSEILRHSGAGENLLQCADLVRDVPVRRLHRGSFAHLDRLADLVLEDVHSISQCEVVLDGAL